MAGGASAAEIAAPAAMAASEAPAPSRRCTRSRRTRARPAITTPLGAMSPGATGTRHGLPAGHTVPRCPIIQFAAGIVSA